MYATKPGKALFAGGLLVMAAIAAAPALAAAAVTADNTPLDQAPLDSAVLSSVTALGLGAHAVTPSFAATGNPAPIAPAEAFELPRAPEAFQTLLNLARQPDGHDYGGTSQMATNLALAVTLNGTTNFTAIRQ